VADHPWPIGRAFVNIAKLLLEQRADVVPMAVVTVMRRQVFATYNLWLMSAALVALMGDPVVL
jgi:hypothetical protein